MNDKIKTWLYIMSTILVIGIVGYLAFKLLILFIPVIIVLYIIFKIKGYIDRKNSTNSTVNETYEYTSSYDNKIDDIDESAGEVIDVDYEDVNK